MLLLGKILYIEKKYFNTACQYLDIMDEYLLFEYLLFNIHFSPCSYLKRKIFLLQVSEFPDTSIGIFYTF